MVPKSAPSNSLTTPKSCPGTSVSSVLLEIVKHLDTFTIINFLRAFPELQSKTVIITDHPLNPMYFGGLSNVTRRTLKPELSPYYKKWGGDDWFDQDTYSSHGFSYQRMREPIDPTYTELGIFEIKLIEVSSFLGHHGLTGKEFGMSTTILKEQCVSLDSRSFVFICIPATNIGMQMCTSGLNRLERSLDENTNCHWHCGCMTFFGEDAELTEMYTDSRYAIEQMALGEVEGVSPAPGFVVWNDSMISVLTSNATIVHGLKTLRMENISSLPINLALPNVSELSLSLKATKERPLIQGLFAPKVRKFVVHYNGKVPRMVSCFAIGSSYDFGCEYLGTYCTGYGDARYTYFKEYLENCEDKFCTVFELVGTASVCQAENFQDYIDLDGQVYLDLSFIRNCLFRTVLIGPGVPLSLINPYHLQYVVSLRLVLSSPQETAGVVGHRGFQNLFGLCNLWVTILGPGVDVPPIIAIVEDKTLIEKEYTLPKGQPCWRYDDPYDVFVSALSKKVSIRRFVDSLSPALYTLTLYSSPRLVRTTNDLADIIGIDSTQWMRIQKRGVIKRLSELNLTGVDPSFLGSAPVGNGPHSSVTNDVSQGNRDQLTLKIPIKVTRFQIQPLIFITDSDPDDPEKACTRKGPTVQLEGLNLVFESCCLPSSPREFTLTKPLYVRRITGKLPCHKPEAVETITPSGPLVILRLSGPRKDVGMSYEDNLGNCKSFSLHLSKEYSECFAEGTVLPTTISENWKKAVASVLGDDPSSLGDIEEYVWYLDLDARMIDQFDVTGGNSNSGDVYKVDIKGEMAHFVNIVGRSEVRYPPGGLPMIHHLKNVHSAHRP